MHGSKGVGCKYKRELDGKQCPAPNDQAEYIETTQVLQGIKVIKGHLEHGKLLRVIMNEMRE